MAKIEYRADEDGRYTVIKLENVAEEKAANSLARSLEEQTSNPDATEMHGLGNIHQIAFDPIAAEITCSAFDTFMGEGAQPHAIDGTYANEIKFSIEAVALGINKQMNGN